MFAGPRGTVDTRLPKGMGEEQLSRVSREADGGRSASEVAALVGVSRVTAHAATPSTLATPGRSPAGHGMPGLVAPRSSTSGPVEARFGRCAPSRASASHSRMPVPCWSRVGGGAWS